MGGAGVRGRVPDAPPERYAANLKLARQRFDADVADMVAFVETRMATLFTGAMSIFNPLAKTVFHHVGVRESKRRVEIQFALHDKAARDVPRLGVQAAGDAHLAEVLANDDFLARIDPKHPQAATARALVEEAYRVRLGPIAKVLHEGSGATFDELMASAMTRAELERILADEFAVARRLLDLAERSPGLVKAPKALLPKLLAIGRDVLTWYEARTRADLDRVYPASASRTK